jgi:hypothetical protein
MAVQSDVEYFARLVDALEPWLDQVVIIGGRAHRFYCLHPSVLLNLHFVSCQRCGFASYGRMAVGSEEHGCVYRAILLESRKFMLRNPVCSCAIILNIARSSVLIAR